MNNKVKPYLPLKALGKQRLMSRGRVEPKIDSTLTDEPSVEIRKGQIRGTNTFEIENVILCEKVYGPATILGGVKPNKAELKQKGSHQDNIELNM